MNGIDRLYKAVWLLKAIDEFTHIQLIGELSWSSIPESYKIVKTYLTDGHRIEIYNLGKNTLVSVSDVGLFQIM